MNSVDPVTAILKEMGRKPSELLSACMNKVSSIRNTVIRYSRIITLAPFANEKLFKNIGVQFPKSYKSYVFKPDDLPSFLGFSQMTQNTGFLLCFVNEHPDLLAKAVLARLKSSDFLYLTQCAIPATFGYFSSLEHLDIAIKFYRSIVVKCDQDKANFILRPLLCSVATFRFLEVAFAQFTNFLAINGSENKNQDDNLCSKYFVECITKALPLLPQQILDLFRLLFEMNWDPKKFGDLFFFSFLWKYAKIFVLCSPAKNQFSLLQKIIFITSKNDNLISTIYKTLFNCKSDYDLPCIYQPFGHLYLNFYISVHDIQSIAQLLHSCKLMPETVTLKELKRVPDDYSFFWYSCQAFPHISYPQLIDTVNEPIFDINTPEKKLFELLLNNSMYKSELKKWKKLICSCINVNINSFIEEEVSLPLSRPFMKSYRMFKNSFGLPILNRKIFLSLLEKNIDNWIGNKAELFNHLDQQFNQILDSIDKTEEMIDYVEFSSSIHKSHRSIMLYIIQKLKILQYSPMSDQFEILIDVMKRIEFILKFEHYTEHQSKSIYPIIFRQSDDKHLFSIFFKLNSFAMQNPSFLELCKDDEKSLWLKIEQMILRCLKIDPVFLKAYVTLQNEFMQCALKNTMD